MGVVVSLGKEVLAIVRHCLAPVVVRNAGDSRAFILHGNGTYTIMSKDHKPSDPEEVARITRAGGFVSRVRKVFRVDGTLSLSRAFGDIVRRLLLQLSYGARGGQSLLIFISKTFCLRNPRICVPAVGALGPMGKPAHQRTRESSTELWEPTRQAGVSSWPPKERGATLCYIVTYDMLTVSAHEGES